jgi:hypothetical protein
MDKEQCRSLKADIKRLTETLFDPTRIKKIKELLPNIEDATIWQELLKTREGKQLTEFEQLLREAESGT